jgi:F-type H+-transporting ATPase subunit b
MMRARTSLVPLFAVALALAAVTASAVPAQDEEKDHPAESKGAEEHATGEHHDDTALDHANASDELLTPSEWRFDHVLASWIVFGALLLLVGKLAWRPIMGGLEKREESIKKLIDEAQHNADVATERLQQLDARLAAAADEARAIVARAQQDAEKTSARLLADAEEAAQREKVRALADIEAAKSAALSDIADKSVDMAVSLAGRIVKKQLSSQDHAQLIQDALEQFPSRN